MWEIDEESDFHYRCHVGHAYSAERMNRFGLSTDVAVQVGVGTGHHRATV